MAMSRGGISDEVKMYCEYRTKANKAGVWLSFVSPILLALSRSREFKLKDPTGLIEDSIHNGYIAAYGHFIILMLCGYYWISAMACARMREVVIDDGPKKEPADKATRTELYLLRPPFSSASPHTQGKCSRATSLVPLIVGASAYVVFLYYYFGFRADGRDDFRWRDLLLGAPGGFKAHWDHQNPKTLWINAPEQTWLGLAGLLLIGWWIWSLSHRLSQQHNNPSTQAALSR